MSKRLESNADWDSVTVLGRPGAGAGKGKHAAVTSAMRKGDGVDTVKKFGGGENRAHSSSIDTAKLDRETDAMQHDRVSLSVGKAIQQGRMALSMTQKDLATKINEKPTVINEYEAGRAIPNQQVLSKIERAIKVKLRGKDIGSPLAGPSKKK